MNLQFNISDNNEVISMTSPCGESIDPIVIFRSPARGVLKKTFINSHLLDKPYMNSLLPRAFHHSARLIKDFAGSHKFC